MTAQPLQIDLLIKNGLCVLPGGTVQADVAVVQGRIVDIGHFPNLSASKVIDATGLHVLPGVIDSQVHFREPGYEYKEDLESGTRGAVLGGVTTVFEMPNTKPQTLTKADLQYKLDRAKETGWCNHAFYIGAAASNIEELAALEQLPGVCGVKVFMGSSTGGLLIEDDETLLKVLQTTKRRIAVHCEDEPRLRERVHIAKDGAHPKFHPIWRDEISALTATERLVKLAHQTNRWVHVLHVTTAEEMAFLKDHKRVATVEITPQHLTLYGPECYERLGTYAQMNPPIRDKHHQDALWQAVNQGIVDVLGSDHAPHTKEEKEREYPKSPAGMPGVQTLLPIMLNHVHEGRLTLDRLVDLVCHGPARIFNMACKGRLVVGYDADFTLVDLNAKRTITHDWMATKSGWTPFDGMSITGWPIYTIINGQVVMQENELFSVKVAQPVQFWI